MAVVLLANVFFGGWEMSKFGGGKCPNFGGGKCPPGKWLTIQNARMSGGVPITTALLFTPVSLSVFFFLLHILSYLCILPRMKLPAVITAATTATTNTTPINPMSKTCDFLCHAFFQICQIVICCSHYCCVHFVYYIIQNKFKMRLFVYGFQKRKYTRNK